MRRCVIVPVFIIILQVCLFRSPQSFADTDHSFLSTYEGSKTCRGCHESAVTELTHALHYRMLGQVQGVYDMFTNRPVTGEKGKSNRY